MAIKRSIEMLKNHLKTETEKYWKGFDDGYEKAKSVFRIWYYCYVCGKEITVYPNREDHKDIIEYMKKEGWAHEECVKKL